MNEYKKRLAQQGNGQLNSESAAAQSVNGIPNSALNAVFAGTRKATSEMMGHREDPAPSVMARMSQSFGMDFSGVQVYRSDAMAGTEMHGMAQGNKVVIGSDVNLNTTAGQAILGHEFSHIRAQSMGIGTGNGLLRDAALEHRADSEGMLAARGMNISGESMGMSMGLGMAGVENLSPIGSGLSASAGAPMQAEKGGDSDAEILNEVPKEIPDYNYDESKPIIGQIQWMNGNDDHTYLEDRDGNGFSFQQKKLSSDLSNEYTPNPENLKKNPFHHDLMFAGKEYGAKGGGIEGLGLRRISRNFDMWFGSDFSKKYIKTMFEYMNFGMGKKDEATNIKYNKKRLQGAKMYKEMIYHELKKIEKKYGTVLHDMDPNQAAELIGVKELSRIVCFNQDAQQLQQESNGEKFNKELEFADPEKEADYQRLRLGYDHTIQRIQNTIDLQLANSRLIKQKPAMEELPKEMQEEMEEGMVKPSRLQVRANEIKMAKNDERSKIRSGPSLSAGEKETSSIKPYYDYAYKDEKYRKEAEEL